MEKERIKKVLDGMLGALKKEEVELYKSLIDRTCYKKTEGIEDFYLGMVYPFEKYLSGLIKIEISNSEDVEFILKRSRFIESHFEALIQGAEGSACCADKSRIIMKGLLDFYKDGKQIVFDYKQEYTYHLPSVIFKTHESIIGFYEGLRGLYYGNPQKYLASLLEIAKSQTKEKVGLEENKHVITNEQ